MDFGIDNLSFNPVSVEITALPSFKKLNHNRLTSLTRLAIVTQFLVLRLGLPLLFTTDQQVVSVTDSLLVAHLGDGRSLKFVSLSRSLTARKT